MDPGAMDEHRSVVQTGFMGLAVREKHLVTRRWPNRLVHSKKDKPSLRDFNRWLGWPSTVPLRWLEWKRCGDVTNEDWDSWMQLATSMSRFTFEQALESIMTGVLSDDGEAEAGEVADKQPDHVQSGGGSESDGEPEGPEDGGAEDEVVGGAKGKQKKRQKQKRGKKSKGKKK